MEVKGGGGACVCVLGWGGGDSCRPGGRGGSSERKRHSIGLCQGQFAVNRLLHLAALSPHAAGGPRCNACWEGPRPLTGQNCLWYNPHCESAFVM